MFALLFDRRSLIVTGVALVGVGSLLFAAGVVTGLTLRRERVVVPPYWLQYGPVETSDVRGTDPARGASPSRPAPAEGDAAAGDPSTPPDWVPFAKPGDPTLSEPSPPPGGVRATPPPGVTQGGAAQGGVTQGGATQDGVGKGGAGQDAGEMTPAPPAATPAPPAAEGSGDGGGAGESSGGAAKPGSATPGPGPGAGAEAPRQTTRRAANDCPEPGEPTWYVQTGAYAVAGNARSRRDSLQARLDAETPRPYLSRTTSRAGVELTLVRLGPFTTRQAARRAAAALDDAFVGRETGESAGGCGEGDGAVAKHGLGPGDGAGTVALANRVSPAG